MNNLLLRVLALAVFFLGSVAPMWAVPVTVNADSSFEGLADASAGQNPIVAGFYEIGWLNSGVTQTDIATWFAAGDLASIDAAFNTVLSFSWTDGSPEETNGNGLIFKGTDVVSDHTNAGALTAYTNAATGAAGKPMVGWIRDHASLSSTTKMAFVKGDPFPTANDLLGFSDFSASFSTDPSLISASNVWVGAIATVLTGGGVDNNPGTGQINNDGSGLYGSTFVFQLANVPVTAGFARLAFSAGAATVVENAGSVTVTVTRSGKLDNAVTVDFATANGSGIAGVDYTDTTGTLTFIANDVSETIVVPVADPASYQGDRSFAITLSNALPAGGAELGTPVTIAVTIQDDETAAFGTIQLSAATYSKAENAGPVTVTVRRVGGSDGAVSATLATTDGTATSPGDFTAASQAVNFAAGDAADKTINIVLNDDTTFEGDETFTVVLSAATGAATLGTPASATVTMTENDAPPTAGLLSFTAPTYSGSEGAGSSTISVTRTGGTTGAVGVQYATSDGTAIAPGDYTTTTNTLSWATGEAGVKTFTVPVISNSVDEADKTFTVALSAPTGGAAIMAPSTAVVTITDDDTAGAFAFSATTATVVENAGQVALTINRAGGTAGAVDVLVNTADGSAPVARSTDYGALTNQVVAFTAGQTSKTVSVPINDTAGFAGNRKFNVVLTSASGGGVIGANATATVTITDNDTPIPGRLSLDAATYSATEGTATVTITVLRTDGSDGEVKVTYTAVNGTARAPGDFPATTGQLTFAQGDVSETFTVAITDDNLAEASERFTVKLSAPTNGAKLGARPTTTVTIEDNEPTYRLENATSAATEGTNVSIKVLRSNDLATPRSVNWRTLNGTAVAGRDFAGAGGTLLFDTNVAEQTITIPVLDDLAPEGAETFRVSLGKINATDTSVGLSAPATATVTIARSDAIEQPDLSVSSGSGFVGTGVFNSTGTNQSLIRTSDSATFTVRVKNAGNAPDNIVVRGVAGGSANSGTVKVTRSGKDVSAAVLSAAGLTLTNVPTGGLVELKVSVSVRSGPQFSGYGVTLTGASAATSSKVDTVKASVVRR